uniref:Putative secreted protein n=1 Tax=Anopheles darlingi TaxID=43151 RepID=A0A2M4DID3_ANODA
MRPLRLSRVLLHLFSRFLAIETMYCSNCPSDSSDQFGMRCRRSSGVRPIFALFAAPLERRTYRTELTRTTHHHFAPPDIRRSSQGLATTKNYLV